MFEVFKGPLNELTPDPALKNLSLISRRLATASNPLSSGSRSRFVIIPVAAGAKEGTLSLGMMTPQQMIRGGAISKDKKNVIGAHVQIVPVVNIVSWITHNSDQADTVIVKMDIEGAEFPILDSFIYSGNICKIDILAMECHRNAGNCKTLKGKLKDYPCLRLLEEGSGYRGWDHYSSPDKYYAIDPRQ